METKYITLLFFIFTLTAAFSQDQTRFQDEIEAFKKIDIDGFEDIVIFTGSSSIRLWKSLANDCNNLNLINTGFGGSTMTDLLVNLNETVLRFSPKEVYIYEGDNDINDGHREEDIIMVARDIVKMITRFEPDLKIHFIGAKPSPSRWHHRERYIRFNNLLKEYCDSEPNLFFIDVWDPMLNESGRPNPEIFIADSLHMNEKGYQLWTELICK